MVKRLYLILLLLLAVVAPMSAVLTVDDTEPISDNNRVIYELNLYDFTSQGTLAAAQQRLPELRKLGIDIIWLMPIHPRGEVGKIGTLGSPYAVKDYKAVNPHHGTMANLQSFVLAAHDLGMKVWLDWVPNHTAKDHGWVYSHPEYYHRINGVIQSPPAFGDVYQLDFRASSGLADAMIDAMLYWVNQADIDGFRCDYVSSTWIGANFLKRAIDALQNNTRGKRVEFLAEADFSDSNVSNSSNNLFSAGFRYDYAWGFADAIKSVGKGSNASALNSAANSMLSMLNEKYTQMSRMTYITNHDDIGNNFSDNYMTVLGNNVAPLTVMYFTFCGIPLLYNGQEIGQTKILNYFERNSIDWNTVNVPLANTIRVLVALKHTQPALADGNAAECATTRLLSTNHSSVFAFEKQKGDNRVIVVINLSDNPVDVRLSSITSGTYERVIDSQTIGSSFATTTVDINSTSTIHLIGKGYHVYTNDISPSPVTTYHIYINNQTGWSQTALYAWAEGRNDIIGGWPGIRPAGTIKKNGVIYQDFPVDASVFPANFIFNNNADGKQLKDIYLSKVSDYYLTATSAAITEDKISTSVNPTEIDNIRTTKIIQNGQLFIHREEKKYTILGHTL